MLAITVGVCPLIFVLVAPTIVVLVLVLMGRRSI
jgi:hypothetical protein